MTQPEDEFMENILKANEQWLHIINSREWQPALVGEILKESKRKEEYTYMGTYEIASKRSVAPANRLAEPNKKKKSNRNHHFDLIFIEPSTVSGYATSDFHPTQQSQFSTFDDFISKRRTPYATKGIYFLGELHPETESEIGVHWNVMIIDHTFENGKINVAFFDPAIDETDKAGYDFESVAWIFDSIKKYYTMKTKTIYLYKAIKRPQQYCRDLQYGIDTFCQTWSLIFVDALVNDLWDDFRRIDFTKHQTGLVKAWVRCWFDKTGWDSYARNEEQEIWHSHFPYSIRYDERRKRAEKIDPARLASSEERCIEKIVAYALRN